jgi:hypothetical protein
MTLRALSARVSMGGLGVPTQAVDCADGRTFREWSRFDEFESTGGTPRWAM